MAPVFSPDIIARVKDETDIVEVVRQHVSLKPAGSVYKGLCPFHREKTPSFIVTPARQRYHCFGCATGGDVISFTMEVEGVTFPEAVEILARPLDIDLSAWLKDDDSEGERRAFHRANEVAMTLWRDAFWDPQLGKGALTYLQDRGFKDKALRDFDVGWAPGGSDWLAAGLKNGGVDADLARQADLMRPSDRGGAPFAYFRSRIIFPIKNISRQVAGFGGRVIDQGEPKYLNSSDSSYFTKGKLLYGFEASRMAIAREKSAILVEGYLDLLALAQVGIVNVVATCGTAFTPDQARLIRRGAKNVVLLFDGDKAGLKAAVRSADIALQIGLEPKIVSLPGGKDPADVVIGDGPDAMHEALKSGTGYIPFLKGLADARGGDREVRERALRQALGTIARIEDALRREYVLQEAAETFGLKVGLLREAVEKEAAAARPRYKSNRGPGPGGTAPVSSRDDDSDQAGSGPGSDEVTANVKRRTGPQVRRSLATVNAEPIEADMLSHILMDDSGEAARVFLAERGDLELSRPEARFLVDELSAWGADRNAGRSPRDFVLDRWNSSGDKVYRDFVSQLINKEDRPDSTDFIKVIRDCLGTLRRNLKLAEARRGSVHTGE
ncbi:MAG: DNA primase [Candidatus Krumholzibacteriota bacterium]